MDSSQYSGPPQNQGLSLYYYAKLLDSGLEPPFDLEFGPGRSVVSPGVVRLGLTPSADWDCHIYHNLENGIPLPDACVRSINTNQFLEHIQAIIHLYNEMWRVMQPGSVAVHKVPHYLSPFAWADPTHVRAFSQESFKYYCVNSDGKPFVDTFSDYGIKCAFELVSMVQIGDVIEARMRKP